jgi:hypothetical protein
MYRILRNVLWVISLIVWIPCLIFISPILLFIVFLVERSWEEFKATFIGTLRMLVFLD